jgi:hypothetical protein
MLAPIQARHVVISVASLQCCRSARIKARQSVLGCRSRRCRRFVPIGTAEALAEEPVLMMGGQEGLTQRAMGDVPPASGRAAATDSNDNAAIGRLRIPKKSESQ